LNEEVVIKTAGHLPVWAVEGTNMIRIGAHTFMKSN